MAGSNNFCRKCGTKVTPGEKFCSNCGFQLAGTAAQREPKQIKPKAFVCPECGKELSPGVKFCRYCGKKLSGQGEVKSDSLEKYSAGSENAGGGEGITAASHPGEFEAMAFTLGSEKTAAQAGTGAIQATSIMSPLGTIWESIKSVLGGAFGLFGQPKMLILTVLLALVWIILGMNQNSDSPVTEFLSWLTFARGGLGRDGFMGTLGGICGKGAVGAMLLSVFNGGIPRLGKGVGALFSKTEGKMGVLPVILGFFMGAITDFAFTGVGNTNAGTTMAGLSGIVLSLQALGSKEGILYSLAESFTAGKVDGMRTARDGKIKSLIIGLISGFGFITAVTSML